MFLDMSTLEDVKEFAIHFIKIEMEMLQKVSTLSPEDISRFNKWYETNPHYLKLQELMRKG